MPSLAVLLPPHERPQACPSPHRAPHWVLRCCRGVPPLRTAPKPAPQPKHFTVQHTHIWITAQHAAFAVQHTRPPVLPTSAPRPTLPQVFEYFFDGERAAPRGRDSLLKLEVIAPGTLNAVAFWFDLHLDDMETLSNGGLLVVFAEGWWGILGGMGMLMHCGHQCNTAIGMLLAVFAGGGGGTERSQGSAPRPSRPPWAAIAGSDQLVL